MTLATAGLLHYWRAHLAVALGVAAGASALVGAMLVGDSLRGSLRDQAAAKTAGIDLGVVAGAPFADDLPQRLGTRLPGIGQTAEVLQALRLPAAVRSADSGERVNGAAVHGIDGSWARAPHSFFSHAPAEDEALLSDALARELHVSAGQDVVLYLPRHTDSSPETLFGRRDDATVPLRLRVGEVLPSVGMGEFALRPAADRARNVFVNWFTLARATRLTSMANLLLVRHSASSGASGEIEKALHESLSLRDVGASIRVDLERGYLSIESRSLLIAPEIESAAFGAAADAGAAATGIISYLANEIRLTEQPERSIPYSTVAAITPGSTVAAKFEQLAGERFAEFHNGQLLLNEWAAKSLGASLGDALDLTYYVTGKFGAIETRTSMFTLGGIVALRGTAADPGFVPTLAGVTDARHMGDWDPPFLVDLKKIRPQDEQYWDEHRTTPKAFVLFDDGQRRWTEADGRFGVLTSIRVEQPGTEDLAALAKRIESSLLARVRPASLGWSIISLRDMAKAAADGPTDFAQLFLAFSFFLIVSGLVLVALLFRLGVERRGVEIGTLLALGFRPRTVLRVLLAEGAVVAGVGSLLGLAGAVGYAALLLAGLRTIWSAAAAAPALALHVQPTSLLLGYVINLACAMFAIWASVRRIAELPPRTLLAGNAGAEAPRQSRRRDHGLQLLIVLGVLLVALLATMWTGIVPAAIGFFLCGTAAVCAAVVAARLLFLRGSRIGDLKPGWSAASRMALRNAGRAAGRSTLIVTLLASATFLIIALSAFRIDAESTDRKDSGTGGFALLATASTPLLADLNQPGGRELAGLIAPPPAGEDMPVFFPFRASEGDAIGCRNLYRRQQPRLLGATESFLIRGGFRFSETALPSASNPWLLLNSFRRDGVIPVIGDEAAVRWQIHKGLGETIAIRDEQGRSRELRFVALLSGSVLQDELIVSEDAFLDLFPSSGGYSTFLIETPGADAVRVDAAAVWLETSLSNWGVDVKSTREKLAEFLAVQNTYLSSFQTLGAFGLMLGALGLTAVMLRNIWERRRETALLAALGFGPRAIRRQILLENAWLIVLGLACGAGPALLAIAPAAAARPTAIPWSVLTLTLGGVSAVALLSAWAALWAGWRKTPASVLKMESS